MSGSRTTALLGALIVSMAASGGPAHAASAVLKGQVVGSPYVADATRTAVPVLLSKESARKARLASPLGVVIVPRRTGIASADGTVLPSRMRLGDRFTGRASISKAARKATYLRLTLKSTRITKRSKQLSTAELEEQLAKTRKDLAGLSGFVTQLASYTSKGFTDLGKRVSAVETQLATVEQDLAGLRSQVTTLAGDLTTARTALQASIDLVRADLQPQITTISSGLTAMTAAIGACGTNGTIVDRICDLETGLAGILPADLGPLTDRVDQISGALTGLVNNLTGLTLTGDLPSTLTNEITNLLVNLSGLSGTVSGLGGQLGTLTTNVTSLDSGLTSVTGLLDGVDVGALSATVGGITGQVGNLITTLGTNPDGLTSSVLGALQTSLTGAQGQVTGILSYLSPGDSSLATTADNLLDQATATLGTVTGTTLPLIQGQLSTVCTTWRTTLSGVSAPVYNLLAVLLGSATLPVLPSC